jgi:hypothetical protein
MFVYTRMSERKPTNIVSARGRDQAEDIASAAKNAEAASAAAAPGGTAPDGMGLLEVLGMTESMSRSRYMLAAVVPDIARPSAAVSTAKSGSDLPPAAK